MQADIPAAAVNGVVRAVLVDPGAEAGRAELEGHCSPWPKGRRDNVTTLQVFDLDHPVRVLALDEPRGLHREVPAVAVTARSAEVRQKAKELGLVERPKIW